MSWAVVTTYRNLRDAEIVERCESASDAVEALERHGKGHTIERIGADGKLRWLTADEQYELTKAEIEAMS